MQSEQRMSIRIRKLIQSIKRTVQRRHSEMVRRIIDRYGVNGGLAVAPVDNIDFHAPVDNIIAMCQTIRDSFPHS